MFPGAVNQRQQNSVYHWFKLRFRLRTDYAVEQFLKNSPTFTYPSGRINWRHAYEVSQTIRQDYAQNRDDFYDWIEERGPRGPHDD